MGWGCVAGAGDLDGQSRGGALATGKLTYSTDSVYSPDYRTDKHQAWRGYATCFYFLASWRRGRRHHVSHPPLAVPTTTLPHLTCLIYSGAHVLQMHLLQEQHHHPSRTSVPSAIILVIPFRAAVARPAYHLPRPFSSQYLVELRSVHQSVLSRAPHSVLRRRRGGRCHDNVLPA